MSSKSENEGRLEVCLDQRWGTVNGDGWTHADTEVACRQLGYSTSGICLYIRMAEKYTDAHLCFYTKSSSTTKAFDIIHGA